MRLHALYSVLCVVLLGSIAMASEGHGGGEPHSAGLDEHTLRTVIYQCINVGAIIFGMIYFLRSQVKDFFKNKKAEFIAASERTKAAKKQAEEEHLQITVRLNKLESTAEESVSRARAEAAEMRNAMMAEAAAISKRLREEAKGAAKIELERAIFHLREDLIRESVAIAKAQLSSAVSGEDHARLQSEFVNNIGAAQT